MHELLDARLDDGTPAGRDAADLEGVHIDAYDVVPTGRQARRRDGSDISEAQNRDSHASPRVRAVAGPPRPAPSSTDGAERTPLPG